MKQGTTKTGFAFEVDEALINDMEFIDAYYDIANGDPTAFSLIVKKMFTPEQKAAMYDHCRDDKGRVAIEKVGAEITDILLSFGEDGKNL